MSHKRNTRQNKTTQINTRIEPDLLEKLSKIAKNEQRSKSWLARMAIREFVERRAA